MLKSCEYLAKGQKKTMGNHRVETGFMGRNRFFYYHQTAICIVDDEKRIFFTQNGGWNTSSTNRAIGSYVFFFKSEGYREVTKDEFYN